MYEGVIVYVIDSFIACFSYFYNDMCCFYPKFSYNITSWVFSVLDNVKERKNYGGRLFLIIYLIIHIVSFGKL